MTKPQNGFDVPLQDLEPLSRRQGQHPADQGDVDTVIGLRICVSRLPFGFRFRVADHVLSLLNNKLQRSH